MKSTGVALAEILPDGTLNQNRYIMLRTCAVTLIFIALIGCSDSSQVRYVMNSYEAVDTISFNASAEAALSDTVFVDTTRETVVYAVAPKYPEDAQLQGLGGTVWLKALVDSNGSVTKAVVLQSDYTIFNRPALRALMQWIFKPSILNGRRAVWLKVPIRFKLH
jgi:TonB family protein